MRRRVLPICLGALIVTAVLAVSIGPAGARRASREAPPSTRALPASPAVVGLVRALLHARRPPGPGPGSCSVSGPECVGGCTVPVGTIAGPPRAVPAGVCEGAAGAKPCLLPIAAVPKLPGPSGPGALCASSPPGPPLLQRLPHRLRR